jgi:hypothetical protein
MKNLGLVFALSIFLISCFVTEKQREVICNNCKTHTTEYIRDSIYLKDTVVFIEPDSASVEALLECDSLGNVRIVEISSLQGRIVKLETQLRNNRFKAKAQTDTVKVYVKGNTQIRWRVINKVIEKPVTIYKDYWWKWPLLLWALFTTIVFVIKFRTSIFSFIKKVIA